MLDKHPTHQTVTLLLIAKALGLLLHWWRATVILLVLEIYGITPVAWISVTA